MSSSSRSYSSDAEELLQFGTRCQELRKEKDLLKESKSQSLELTRRLEQHVKYLSESRKEDKKHIENLEKELMNCSQEIDYLQDQLNTRNSELDGLLNHVRSLELKLVDMENLQGKVELQRSNSEYFILMQELENKEVEIQKSNLYIEKLEESISSVALESQCEIESVRLDMLSLEQSCFEAKKIQEEAVQEKARMCAVNGDLEHQFLDAQTIIECLDKENKELREKLDTSERNATLFCQKIEEWLDNWDVSQLSAPPCLSELDSRLTTSDEVCCGEVLGNLLPKLAMVLLPDSDVQGKMVMSHQIQDYELLVKQLKEELRVEKLKAKEEAEDLAQEMAELRYQITGLLEEECKRRACIEQASLQRIAQLEAQVLKEQRTSLAVVSHLHNVVWHYLDRMGLIGRPGITELPYLLLVDVDETKPNPLYM